MKRARHDADEQDAFSRFGKLFLHWRPGQRKSVKRRANRRERREIKQGLRADYVIYDEVAEFAEREGLPLTPWQRDVFAWVYGRIEDPASEASSPTNAVYRDQPSLDDLQVVILSETRKDYDAKQYGNG